MAFCGRFMGMDGIFVPLSLTVLGEIQMTTEPAQCQHVATDQNPADLCRRGATPQELSDCLFWSNGPEWLLDDRSTWPKMKIENCPNHLREEKASNKKSEEEGVAGKTSHYQRPVLEQKENNESTTAEWRLDPQRYSTLIRFGRGTCASAESCKQNAKTREEKRPRIATRGKTRC